MTDAQSPTLVVHRTNIGLVVTSKNMPTKEQCIRAAGAVPGTYAAELVSRFHQQVIGGARDLKKEYARYYSEEYASIQAFLYYKYACALKHINALTDALKSEASFVGLVPTSWGSDWQVDGLMGFDDGRMCVLKALGAAEGESRNEDSL